MKSSLAQAFLSAAALSSAVVASSFEDDCSCLANRLQVENTTVWFTQAAAAGTNLTFPGNDPNCGTRSQIISADICRVAISVATSSRSGISAEVWLPRNWTGRFLSTGNGGLAGCIQYEGLVYGTQLGFASVAANGGHNGSSAVEFTNPQVLEDFSYRSVHTGAVVGKQITKAFYGKEHAKSYYIGCSTGGRQGFKEAQSFPDDFDGIVAGAPALAFNNLTSYSGRYLTLTGPPNSTAFVPASLWDVIHQDVLKQCDGLDGYKDGILEDPKLCNYRPENLICAPGTTNTTACLTGAQAATVRAIYSPLYGNAGSLIYPRLSPGGESLGFSSIVNGASFDFTTEWFRYAIYNDTTWDPATLNPDDYDAANRKNPANVQSWEVLTDFKAKGGKILHYHGLQDWLIPPENSERYYDYVSREMNLPSQSLDEFYRLFRISGMAHCTGGEGAEAIGQWVSGAATLEPEGNILMAVVKWVEEGVAPEFITGTKFVEGTKEVDYTRRHCKYPLRNVYQGGDYKNPDSWKCVL